jgi:radical SAM superfamily enzyme YgiQ (UPF0313 family)
MVDFVVLVPAPELNRELFWERVDPNLVYKDPVALARESVFGTVTPPINAIAVATEVARNNFSVEIVDVALEFGVPLTAAGIQDRYTATKQLLQRLQPQHGVLITSLTAREHTALLGFARIVKEVDSDLPVALGGYHANTIPDVFLRSEDVDLVLLGDFEPNAPTLLELMRKRRLRDVSVPNIMSKDSTGRPAPANRVEVRDDSVMSRFDYGLASKYLGFYGMLGSVASKGCPFPCTFCQERSLRTFFANEGTESAVGMAMDILDVYRSNTGHSDVGFYFMDALFGGRRGLIESFVDVILRNNWQFRWTFQSRVDILEGCDFERLHEAGCYLIHLGLESFSPEMLVRMQKTRNPDRYLARFREVIHKADAAGIEIEFNILFGAPGETRETLRETETGVLETLSTYPKSSVNLNLYRLFPETTAYSSAYRREWGSDVLIPDWWLVGVLPELTVTVLPSDQLGPQELLEFFTRMYESDACFRRRGDGQLAARCIDVGGFSTEDLAVIANGSRKAFCRSQ